MRELVWFIGFQVELAGILDWVEESFGKAPIADKLQQEFFPAGARENRKGPTVCQPFGAMIQKIAGYVSWPL